MIIIFIIIIMFTANLPTNIVDFKGFDSSIILISRGGILMSVGDFPESLSQAILVGCNVRRRMVNTIITIIIMNITVVCLCVWVWVCVCLCVVLVYCRFNNLLIEKHYGKEHTKDCSAAHVVVSFVILNNIMLYYIKTCSC